MDFKAFIIRRYYPEKIYVDGSLENYHKLDLQCLTDLRTELARNMKSREIIKNKALREFISYLDEIIEKLHNF